MDLFSAGGSCGARQGRTALGCFDFPASKSVSQTHVIGSICYFILKFQMEFQR